MKAAADRPHSSLEPSDTFPRRHIGPRDGEIEEMLALLGLDSLEALADAAVPKSIRRPNPLTLEISYSTQ